MKSIKPTLSLLIFTLALANTRIQAATELDPTGLLAAPVTLATFTDSLTVSAKITISALPAGAADVRIGFFDDQANPVGYWAELDVQTVPPAVPRLLVKKDNATDSNILAGESTTLMSMILPTDEFTSTLDFNTILTDTTYTVSLSIGAVSTSEVGLVAEVFKGGVLVVGQAVNDTDNPVTTFSHWGLRDEIGIIYTSGDNIAISGTGSAALINETAALAEETSTPSVSVEQAATQDDPTSNSPIAFTVVFSEPVTGFEANDVVLSGSANPSTVSIASSSADGTTYEIDVNGMDAEGTVTASVNAGAAQNEAGNGNTASNSTDNTVTFTIGVVDPPVGPPSPGAAFLSVDGFAVIEAENFDSRVDVGEHRWERDESKAGALGGASMQALPNSGVKIDDDDADEESPQLCYRVHFDYPGKYTLWVRMLGETPSDDSLHGGLNGRVTSKEVAPEDTDVWEWEEFDKQLKIKEPGVHEVCVWMREDGTYVDRLAISIDDDFEPTDSLPESSRGVPSTDGPPIADGAFVETDGLVVFEAEHYVENREGSEHVWVAAVDQPGYSGDAAMYADPNTGARIRKSLEGLSPKLTYLVHLNHGGRYRVWVRGLRLTGSDNSVHIGFEGDPDRTLHFNSRDGWDWESKEVDVGTRGSKRFCIWMREDGTYIDQIILTQLDDFEPTNEVTDESPGMQEPAIAPPTIVTNVPPSPDGNQPAEPGTGSEVPQGPGPVQPEAPAAPPIPDDPAVFDDVALSQPEQPSTALSARIAFEQWQANLFTADERSLANVASLNADADGDGMTNLEDFAFGLDPRVSDAAPVTIGCHEGMLELRYPRSEEAVGWQFTVEQSTDLIHWETARAWHRVERADLQEDRSGTYPIVLQSAMTNPAVGARAIYYRVRISADSETAVSESRTLE